MKFKRFQLRNVNQHAKLDGLYQFRLLPSICFAWNTYEGEKYMYMYLEFINYELELRLW